MGPVKGCAMTPQSEAAPRSAASSLSFTAPIAEDLAQVERILSESLSSRSPRVAEVVDHVRHYRGKRLRPVLLLLTAKACGSVTPAHHTLAAVVEMIHTATLVHDDVLDNATVRRHVPTVNAGWGMQASVLLGDHLFTRAFHLAASVDARACRLIGEATNKVCEGELRQGLERGNLELSETDYFEIIEGKTAELIACCCQLGALYAEADEAVIASMTNYGRRLGIAFQIADDVLDLVGEEQTTGKSLGTDLEQDKLTLPLIRLLGHSNGTGAKVRQLLRSPDNHKRESVLPLLSASDAISYTHGKAQDYAARARADLRCLAPSVSRSILEMLTEQVIHRDH
jgi:octaprenyl-diphosphate synthase